MNHPTRQAAHRTTRTPEDAPPKPARTPRDGGRGDAAGKRRTSSGLRVIALITPTPAWADICTTERPGWDGTPPGLLAETATLFLTLPSAALIFCTALALRLQSAWLGLLATVGWSVLTFFLVFAGGPQSSRAQATAEGCIGSPALFIGLVTAICIATILYTAPAEGRSKP